MKFYQRHPYHLVNPSPWPLLGAIGAFTLTSGGVMYFHSYQFGNMVLTAGLITVMYTMFVWWRDIVRESTFEGHHTVQVQYGLRYGVIFFITSEVMFFAAFFWGYFASSLAPNIEVGGIWPPTGIEVFSPWEVPLLNTMVLLLSGFTVTWAHHAILAGNRSQSIIGLTLTVILGGFFTALQGLEYAEAPFTIADGIYGSCFFMATGFHGLHVLIGTIFLLICLIRLFRDHFTTSHHFGFEAAAWYWHFVDVVWLFLFVSIYWWGGLSA
uniref:Cytochrome c oxidase subunit 3 n=1 Tax=Imasa heleensis TaxID=2772037 RepID=A0A893DD14_9EUKA|nr:cytochrome c oxidase subunit 3 [Imasa heleensis]QRR29749.1 cytochrome c oxidase subunit 3 [Imasa heleensis]